MRSFTTRTVVGLAAGMLLLTGCGGSSESDSDNPSTPREEMLLSEAEFPEGSKVQPITAADLQAKSDEQAKLLETAEIDPAECMSSEKDVAGATKDLLNEASVIAAFAESTLYFEAIIDREQDLSKLAAATTDPCAETTQKFVTEGKSVVVVNSNKKLELPDDLQGDNVLAYGSSTKTSIGEGEPIEGGSYQGFANVRGVTVLVNAVNISEGTPDAQAFIDLFAAAVRKVEDAK
ncbi:hypothetical protein JGU71_14825 [Antrihabitans sp. YC3-6]|uniref:DUF5642 domain-containing protein n=1 Tax=Antrihabitans stalagmiti TaxID=2799499 RepID=A0A934NRM9_9NOCA|nr:hypothetical protein [Antrihabitans stalagmiti]MBJ8340161.1 hypothetical protein [Antrihabitans stalagmiti]